MMVLRNRAPVENTMLHAALAPELWEIKLQVMLQQPCTQAASDLHGPRVRLRNLEQHGKLR